MAGGGEHPPVLARRESLEMRGSLLKKSLHGSRSLLFVFPSIQELLTLCLGTKVDEYQRFWEMGLLLWLEGHVQRFERQ